MADRTQVVDIYKSNINDIQTKQDILCQLNRVIGDVFMEEIFLEDSIARLLMIRNKLERMWGE